MVLGARGASYAEVLDESTRPLPPTGGKVQAVLEGTLEKSCHARSSG